MKTLRGLIHVTALTVSRKSMANVSISMNATLQFAMIMPHARIHLVHLHVLVTTAMKVMASFVRMLTSVPRIYVRKNPNVSIIKVLSHVNVSPDIP